MSMYKYTVALPDGKEMARTSPRTYTHAIAVNGKRGWCLTGYAGNLDLANKAYGRASKILNSASNRAHPDGWTEIRMIPVQVREIKRKTAPAKPVEPVKTAVPQPVLRDERISFGIKWFLTEEDAKAYAKAHSGATYNGGWFHGTSCGRDESWDMEVKAWHHDRDKLDRSIPIGTKLYAVTD